MADCKKYNGSTWEHSLRKLTTATDTITTLPVDVYTDGNNATVGLKGNTVQNGTPTPDSPIMPQGTGERTANLFDSSSITLVPVSTSETRSGTNLGILPQGDYVFSATATVGATQLYRTIKNGDDYTFETIRELPYTFTADGTSEQIIRTSGSNFTSWASTDYTNIMLNSGSTALPYEPYGYKLDISSANTTTNVYLGEAQTTRKIKKLVLTGKETFFRDKERADSWRFYSDRLISAKGNVSICNHFAYIGTRQVNESDTIGFSLFNAEQFGCRCPKEIANTIIEFKAFLAAQYAAGTPVTVWYVLATEETAVVNEPLMKIGDYADTVSGITIPTITGKDTVDVDTTLKPSEVSIVYTGWHDVTVKEWDGSQWNE